MFLLLKDIKAALTEAFDGTVFREPHNGKAEPETYRAVLVRIGSLPPKRQGAAQGEDFPYLVVRGIRGGLAEKNGARVESVTVRIFGGIFTAGSEEDGPQELDVMLGRIRALLASRRFWGDNRWEREMPVQWEAGLREEDHAQPHPYYAGWIEATFSAAGALEIFNPDILG